MSEIIEDKYTRFKDADWFDYLKNKNILVGGAGGIGSWTTLFLARIGMNVYVMDNDKYDETNMAGQFVNRKGINNYKTSTLENIVYDFTGSDNVHAMIGLYDSDSPTTPLMIGAFDNMKARKVFFENWCKRYGESPDALLIDGRLAAQSYQIFCIQGGNQAQIDKYRTEYLFGDEEVAPVSCTLKQTSHAAAGIASHITGFLTNFAANQVIGEKICNVPFLHEYITEPNYTNVVYL